MSDGSRYEVEPQQQRDPFALAEPEVCRPESEGRLGETWPLTIPEQVVGSSHEFEFPSPRNLSSVGAVGVVTMDGSSDLKAGWGTPTAVPGMGTGPFKVTYTPTTVGDQHAKLTLVMKWQDGHIEKRVIQVNARARSIQDVPQSEARAPQTAARPASERHAPDRNLTVDTEAEWSVVRLAYTRLMQEQRAGIALVESESQRFRPKPADRSLWQDLVELAFQVGTGAIAGLVAKYVANGVSRALVNAEASGAAALAGQAAIADAEKKAIAARGDVVEEREANQALIKSKVGNYANESAAAHTKQAEVEIGAMTGSAVARGLLTVATEIRGPQGIVDNNTAAPNTPDPQPASADGDIAFFAEQSSMSKKLEQQGGKRLTSAIAEQIKTNPEIAKDIMDGVADGLDQAAVGAAAKQALSTSTQFLTYLARTNLGAEQIKTMQGSETVTDMSTQRAPGASLFEASDLAAGVIEIVCDYNGVGSSVRVVDARAKNVSHLVVNRLLDVPLAQSGIPMRVSLYGGQTIITRDEAGRVRVSGMLDLSPPHREEQQVREAERILSVVFSKNLKSWGVPQIHTNDATQGPDPVQGSAKS